MINYEMCVGPQLSTHIVTFKSTGSGKVQRVMLETQAFLATGNISVAFEFESSGYIFLHIKPTSTPCGCGSHFLHALPFPSVGGNEELASCLLPLGSTASSWMVLGSICGTWFCSDPVCRGPVTCLRFAVAMSQVHSSQCVWCSQSGPEA